MSAAPQSSRAQLFVTGLAGVLFGVGLALAGMTQPARVIGFLDVTRHWDPTLMFVMVGGILVHTVGYRLATRRATPLLAARFLLPTRRDLDARLLGGAALFGVGWGLGGFCPGPGITSLVTGQLPVIAFVLAMLVGLAATGRAESLRTQSAPPPSPQQPA